VRFLLSIVLSLSFAAAHAAPPTSEEADTYAGLLNWAIKLSGYVRPATSPVIEFVPQAFFEANACGGRQCRVWGWYPNAGKPVIYVHESARALIEDNEDPRSLLAASIIVHEFTHFLQAASRGFAQYTCPDALALEREAYSVQKAYILAYGRYMPVGVSMHNAGCD
jgi:hypothetical protein